MKCEEIIDDLKYKLRDCGYPENISETMQGLTRSFQIKLSEEMIIKLYFNLEASVSRIVQTQTSRALFAALTQKERQNARQI